MPLAKAAFAVGIFVQGVSLAVLLVLAIAELISTSVGGLIFRYEGF